jgi:Fic family protein
MILAPPTLDTRERSVIERVALVRGSLQYAIRAVPQRWTGLLRRDTLARAVQGSNSIEGYNVSIEDAIAAGADQDPLEADEESWAAVRGYQEAMTYIMTLSDDPHFRYSTDLVRSLHYMMLNYDSSKHPGRWRPGPIYVRDEAKDAIVYEAPNAEVAPPLMDELMEGLDENDSTPPLERAAMAHLNLVMIHPFSDGNGRMARALQTLVLARTGTLAPPFSSIEEYLGRNTRAYYDVLTEVGRGKWQPRNDARAWVRFCLRAHFFQATTLLRRSREIERLWNLLEVELDKTGLPDRLLFALAEAAMGLRVRNATYRPAVDVSLQVAGRDLRLAAEAGFLIAHGERRGRFYRAAPRLLQIREQTRESKAIADPFEGPGPEVMELPGLGS